MSHYSCKRCFQEYKDCLCIVPTMPLKQSVKMKKQVTTEIRLSKQDVKDILVKALKLDSKTATVIFHTTVEYDQFDRGPGTPTFVDVSIKTTQDLEF